MITINDLTAIEISEQFKSTSIFMLENHITHKIIFFDRGVRIRIDDPDYFRTVASYIYGTELDIKGQHIVFTNTQIRIGV